MVQVMRSGYNKTVASIFLRPFSLALKEAGCHAVSSSLKSTVSKNGGLWPTTIGRDIDSPGKP